MLHCLFCVNVFLFITYLLDTSNMHTFLKKQYPNNLLPAKGNFLQGKSRNSIKWCIKPKNHKQAWNFNIHIYVVSAPSVEIHPHWIIFILSKIKLGERTKRCIPVSAEITSILNRCIVQSSIWSIIRNVHVFSKLTNTKIIGSKCERINKILIFLFCFLPQKCQGFHIFTLTLLTK